MFTAPVLMISGQNDTRAPIEENELKLWPLLRAPRVHAVLTGGTHCFIRYECA